MFGLFLSGQRKERGQSQTREYRDKLQLVSNAIQSFLPSGILILPTHCLKWKLAWCVTNCHLFLVYLMHIQLLLLSVQCLRPWWPLLFLCPAKIISSRKLITHIAFRSRDRKENLKDTFTGYVSSCPWFFKKLFIHFFQYQVFKLAKTYFTNISRKKAMTGTFLNTHTLFSSGSLLN